MSFVDPYTEKYLKYKDKYLKLRQLIESKGNFQSGGKSKKEVILFKADWCSHCKTFLPLWKSLQKKYKNKYNFITYDSDANKNMIEKYKINGFPTLYINNKEYTGSREVNELIKYFDSS